jgi:hypothetical protein
VKKRANGRKRRQVLPAELVGLEDGSIDAGLYLLNIATPRGRTWTQEEIAEVCGCSRALIWLIEKRAMAKLRRLFERKFDKTTFPRQGMDYGKEISDRFDQ